MSESLEMNTKIKTLQEDNIAKKKALRSITILEIIDFLRVDLESKLNQLKLNNEQKESVVDFWYQTRSNQNGSII